MLICICKTREKVFGIYIYIYIYDTGVQLFTGLCLCYMEVHEMKVPVN